MNERRLFDSPAARRKEDVPEFADLRQLPDAIWPTRLHFVEQGGDLLVYQRAKRLDVDGHLDVPGPLNRIMHRLLKLASHPDAECGITGVIASDKMPREVAIYDYMTPYGQKPVVQELTAMEIEALCGGWWSQRENRR